MLPFNDFDLIDDLLHKKIKITVYNKLHWCQLLHQHLYQPQLEITSDNYQLWINLAQELDDWYLLSMLLSPCYHLNISTHHWYVYSLFKQGEIQKTTQLLPKKVSSDLEFLIQTVTQGSTIFYGQSPKQLLRLELLQNHHKIGFIFQNWDNTQHNNFPIIENNNDWQLWFTSHQEKQDKLFAFMHYEWGLIGFAGISIAEESGYLFFWLGPDHQDQGLGTHLVNLLTQYAITQLNLKYLFAEVASDNYPSISVLLKNTFIPLNVITTPEQYAIYYYGQSLDTKNYINKLTTLFTLHDIERQPIVL